jgi:hypothetical protein
MTDYANGFKDGFAAGLEEGKKIVEEQWRHDKIKEIEKSMPRPATWRLTQPLTFSADKCPKCGITISGVMNYTCSSINCPTFYTATSSVGKPLTGAVGSLEYYRTIAPGANGSAAPDNNSVWINGEWASLGN